MPCPARRPRKPSTVERPVPSNSKPIFGYGSRRAPRVQGHSRPGQLAPGGARSHESASTSGRRRQRVVTDHVVFVETRSAEKVSYHAGRHFGSLGWGCLRPPRINCRIRAHRVGQDVRWLAHRSPTWGPSWTGSSSKKRTRQHLYFADPTGKTVVPDPRRRGVRPRISHTELVSKLLAGPPGDGRTVRNLPAPPLATARARPGPTARAESWPRVRRRASRHGASPPLIRTAGTHLPHRSPDLARLDISRT